MKRISADEEQPASNGNSDEVEEKRARIERPEKTVRPEDEEVEDDQEEEGEPRLEEDSVESSSDEDLADSIARCKRKFAENFGCPHAFDEAPKNTDVSNEVAKQGNAAGSESESIEELQDIVGEEGQRSLYFLCVPPLLIKNIIRKLQPQPFMLMQATCKSVYSYYHGPTPLRMVINDGFLAISVDKAKIDGEPSVYVKIISEENGIDIRRRIKEADLYEALMAFTNFELCELSISATKVCRPEVVDILERFVKNSKIELYDLISNKHVCPGLVKKIIKLAKVGNLRVPLPYKMDWPETWKFLTPNLCDSLVLDRINLRQLEFMVFRNFKIAKDITIYTPFALPHNRQYMLLYKFLKPIILEENSFERKFGWYPRGVMLQNIRYVFYSRKFAGYIDVESINAFHSQQSRTYVMYAQKFNGEEVRISCLLNKKDLSTAKCKKIEVVQGRFEEGESGKSYRQTTRYWENYDGLPGHVRNM